MDQLKLSNTPKREPLTERQPRNHVSPVPTSTNKVLDLLTGSSPCMPHHESLCPGYNLAAVDSAGGTQAPQTHNKRVSTIAEEDAETKKRDSQTSTVSSTISTFKTKRKTHVGPWQLGKTLGKGATGRVRLAKHAVTGQISAIKIVSKKQAAGTRSASLIDIEKEDASLDNVKGRRKMPFGIEREVVIMKLIEHPHVINLYDIWENRGELYLVLEYVHGGELFDYVSGNGALPEHEAVRLFRQIIAGLSCCHRFNICHRDLKPENILLDEEKNIKLADFGMAALQPANKWLSTSCGSPHYAAPEIIQGVQYRGDKADIWSVGVILFAMLNGFLPFDGGDLPSTLRLVKKGEYFLPPDLSVEASDLIQRMLQRRPSERISMAEIWKHPLLEKYEEYHASLCAPEPLVGPPPPLTIEECGRPIAREDVDAELLRHLRTLWHGEKQETLINQLSSEEPNYEKLFYWALVKFRDDQLENYTGHSLQYSSSDYHHAWKPPPKSAKRPAKGISHTRRPSQFSIVSEDETRRDSYYKNPVTAASKATQGSYDPYRASRTPIIESSGKSTVVVRRTESSRAQPSKPSGLLHHVATSRLLNELQSLPTIGSGEFDHMQVKARYSRSTVTSRSSLASSRQGRVRKSASYKRHVIFPHKRHGSNNGSLRSHVLGQHGDTLTDAAPPRANLQDDSRGLPNNQSTQDVPTPPHAAHPGHAAYELNFKKPRVASYYWKDDTRKVSTELGKICEEAFNRSSVSSTSETGQYRPYDSPATTTSAGDFLITSAIKNRPLPQTPVLKELLERREKIIDTWGDSDPSTLTAILKTLDERIEEEKRKNNEIRAASDPTHLGRFTPLYLHSETGSTGSDKRREDGSRSVSDPTRRADATIRLVTPDPVSPSSKFGSSLLRRSKAQPIDSIRGGSDETRYPSVDGASYDPRLFPRTDLDTIEEDPKSPRKHASESPLNRKWSWLGKKVTTSQENLPPTSLRSGVERLEGDILLSVSTGSSDLLGNIDSEAHATVDKKKHWFQKVFGRDKKKTVDFLPGDHEIVHDDFNVDSRNSAMSLSQVTDRRGRHSRRGYPPATSVDAAAAAASLGPIEIEQNWLARMFHIKPATRMLVLQVNKPRARKELVKTLRDWERYGLKDIVVEKRPGGDVVRGRVDAANYLHIKPVNFHAKVYTVLERGRSAHLSVIKFTQEKGAASSFYRVVNTMRSVMQENNLLLSNVAKSKAIMKTMKEAGL